MYVCKCVSPDLLRFYQFYWTILEVVFCIDQFSFLIYFYTFAFI